ncbi:MAG: hypothetical protein A2498_10895 [Lentisphaerae bacterium RIFOXYC12_FULL_60_16]|nr:MAG: hypothetical protein A2498_10895 [Lentisphaerae bacterium RIFOXYC12_FULL_60_16]
MAEGYVLEQWGYLHDARSSEYILKPVEDALAPDCPVPVSVTGVNEVDGIRLTLSGKGRVRIRAQDLLWSIQTGWIASEQLPAGIADLDGGSVGWYDTNMPVQVGDITGLGRLYYLTMVETVPEAFGSAPDVDGVVSPAAAVTPGNTFLKTLTPAGLSDGDLSIPGTSSPTEGADLVCREGNPLEDGMRVLHVSAAEGDDRFSGRKPDRDGADGPKRTIGAAVTESVDSTLVLVYDGRYPESVRLCGNQVRVVIRGQVTLRKE